MSLGCIFMHTKYHRMLRFKRKPFETTNKHFVSNDLVAAIFERITNIRAQSLSTVQLLLLLLLLAALLFVLCVCLCLWFCNGYYWRIVRSQRKLFKHKLRLQRKKKWKEIFYLLLIWFTWRKEKERENRTAKTLRIFRLGISQCVSTVAFIK